MSGVTDPPFRHLAFKYGAGLVVSEMVASEQLVNDDLEAVQKSTIGEGYPAVVQLAGREAKWMALAAKIARERGADIIDINMGCPAKKVTNGYSGSALMRDLDHALTLIDATVNAVDCPVTLKMRLGWDERSLNAPELAKRAEDAGVQMITVHGRTRAQFYNGEADWAAIRSVKEAICLPLVANGDVASQADARKILEVSGADGVMIGRGTYGRPWLVGQIGARLAGKSIQATPVGKVLADEIAAHYEDMLLHYGQDVGLRAARKHLAWYIDRYGDCSDDHGASLRATLLTEKDPATVLRLIAEMFIDEAQVDIECDNDERDAA